MASPYLTEQAGLVQSPEVVGLERQRKLADLLTSQAFQSPQGQMISGHYVKPATTQQLQPLLSALLATNMNQNLDERQLQMASALRNEENAGIDEYQRIKTEQGPAAANAYLAKSKISALRGAGLKEMFAPPIKAGVEDVLLDPNTFKPLFTGAGKLPPSTQLAIVNLGLPKDPSTWTPQQQQMAANYIPPADKQHLDIARANLAINQQKANQEKVNPQEAGLRTSFFNQAQPHIQISQAYRKIETAPDTAAGDMSKIFGFMKILDPGSTVREGEYASAENARGVPDTVKAQYNKVISGQRLTPKQRTEFTQAAGDLVTSQKQQFDTQKKYYSDIATNYSINPENIIYDPYKDLNLRTTPPKAQLAPVNANQQLNIPAAKPKFLGFEQ
jgi:hypothetical protein